MMKTSLLPLVLLTGLLMLMPRAYAVDFAQGEMLAMPIKEGLAPKIDADLSDWDLSAQEPIYISAQTADTMNAQWAVMYDDEAVYISSVGALPNRTFINTNNPQDAFWNQDIAQVRMTSDPDLTYPLDGNRDKDSNRIAHISFWKNSETDKAFIQISFGTKFNQGEVVNPPGSAIAMDISSPKQYVMEAKIPWSALNVPDGKNPFKPGSMGVFTAESLWIGGDKARTLLNYNRNPGVFAFQNAGAWGKLHYVAKSPGQRIRPSMEKVVAAAKAELEVEPAKVGVPFVVKVPADGLKVSVNIVDAKGAALREILGAEPHPKGSLTVYWDGRDAFQNPLPPGDYHWAAYFHKGLKAVYQGGVGSSGNPYYNTMDGKGAWGGDHSDPIDVQADANSFYFLWPTSEAGKALVQTDDSGKVLWRKNPFVGGGFGPFYAVAANDKYVFLTRGDDVVPGNGKTTSKLVRLIKDTGALTVWDEMQGLDELPISVADHQLVLTDSTPLRLGPSRPKTGKAEPYPEGMARQMDAVGLAADNQTVYFGSYGAGKIFLVDAESGKTTGHLACPGVRGVTLSPAGDLYAVSYQPDGKSQILRFVHAKGQGLPVISNGLVAPYDVAVDQAGRIFVSELGSRQQVQVFAATGQPEQAVGTAGGRAWQGKYDPAAIAFLQPAGIALAQDGSLLVAETSAPKVFSRIAIAESGQNKLVNRWYGPGVYWNATWPMPEDPKNIFYLLNNAIGRANLAGEGKTGVPNATWDLAKAGYPQAGNLEDYIPQPEVIRAKNGELYFIKDSNLHTICLLKDDLMRPIATWEYVSRDEHRKPLKHPYVDVWIDTNADGLVQESERSRWDTVAGKEKFPWISATTSALHMEPNGDLYFMTGVNCIVKVPATGFGKNGLIQWDVSKASLAVPVVLPGLETLHTTFRQGLLGTRLDSKGNLYTVFNTKLKGGTGPYDYPDEATATRMLEGMGHSASFNVVKFAKFDPQGNLLWMAGRKATAGATPGEMYHFWNMSGIVNDQYIAAASEWGQIYFYTQDGFFVDALMNNPGEVTDPGPYTFGGETSGGRVAYFKKSGEVWAYSSGMAYKVEGFKNGKVVGEKRSRGTVHLDKTYQQVGAIAAAQAGPLQIVPLSGQPLTSTAAWKDVPVSTLKRNGKRLAEAQLGYDQDFLYARIAVEDESPLQNGATEEKLVFKGGDTAGIVFGPVHEEPHPGAGDLRIMAARLQDRDRLIAMKAVTQKQKHPEVYETPAGGRRAFDFVGEVPGGKVEMTKTETGYIAILAVPRSFLEFTLEPGTKLRGDVEVRLSGGGQRGLQATSRNYLFTPRKTETTMVDDIPTEARMYPAYWGPVDVK